MSEKLLEEIKKRLECMILLNCGGEVSEKEKMKITADCIGMTEAAKLFGKDLSNFSKHIKGKWIKKTKKDKGVV